MKKITFLPLFLLITQVALSQADAPYFQDFNAIVAGGDNSSIVENWNQYSYGAQTNDGDIWNGWSLNPGLAPSSDAYTLYHDDDQTATGTGVDNWFVLHLDCTSLSEVPFSYDEFQTFGSQYYDFHGVYTSEDYDVANGDAGTQPNGTWTLLREGAATTTPTTRSFTLPNTTTAIAFRFTGEYADNWFIDNISIGGGSNDFSPEGTWVVSSLGVGPNQGDTGWWSNDVSSDERACYYDDAYVFNSDGSFANVLGDETWLEGWQGVDEGCGTPVAPHDGTNAATWIYDSSTGSLTISGLGAYLGLAKAHNGGEDGSPADDTITYIVSSSSETEMTIDIEAGSGVWWRYQMQIQATANLNENILNSIKMYPNPANDYLNFDTNSNENIDVQIFDILGKSVLQLENVRNLVNVSELKSGVYFVQMTLGAKKETKKLIIN